MPIDTKLSMKPTYIKVPVQTVERIKFFDSERLNMIVAQHAEEKETILAENAGLRSMMGLEGSSEAGGAMGAGSGLTFTVPGVKV